jgi:hypothetical protein
MSLVEATTGATSAVIANTIVYPLDVVTSRIQVSSKSPKQVILDLLRKQGPRGFFLGINVSLFQTFLSNFGYFWFYALVKRIYAKYTTKASTGMELLLGALAGAMSRTCTTPVSVITMRKQTSDKDCGYLSIIRQIYTKEGIQGFWRGYGPSLILTINPAITYGLFERIKGTKPKSPWQIFWLGALTKSIATVVTYPYILAKSQIQALDHVHSIGDCFQHLIKKHGLLGLYQGLWAQLSKAVLCQAFLFSFKDYLDRLYRLFLRVKN